MSAKVAVATHPSAAVDAQSWRDTARQAYYVFLGLAGIALLILRPPHLDFHASVVITVAIVAVFLALSEWPTHTAGKVVAPMTAVLGAAAVELGWWTVVLAVISWGAIRLRLPDDRSIVQKIFNRAFFCQTGVSVISAYAMVTVWTLAAPHIAALAPAYQMPARLVAVLSVGLTCQSVNNLLASVAYILRGSRVSLTQLLRPGIVASIYTYLLVAMYEFGGIVAAGLFYTVVARVKILQDIVGTTKDLQRYDCAKSQATDLALDLIRFTDTEQVDFASEVQNIAQMIARHLGLDKDRVSLLGLAAQLHEIGKSRLPAKLRQDVNLNASEKARYLTYSRFGGIMIRGCDALLPPEIANWIEFHTEHFDGSGYPRGLKAEAIPLEARIITVSRDYVRFLTGYDGSPVTSKEKALALLRESSGTHYDPALVDLLVRLVS